MGWLILLICIPAVLLCGCLYAFKICFYSPKDRHEDPYRPMEGEQYQACEKLILSCTQVMDETPCQWVSTTSVDGLTLSGRYYHNQDGAPLLILFHGYRSVALRDCAGGFNMACRLGFNILAVDQRAHGRSGGNVISFGIMERKDCISWIDFARNRFGSQQLIILSGLSMGAATVLMALAEPLPNNVLCVMADCPYSGAEEIIRQVCIRDMHYPDKLIMPFVRMSARLFGRFSLSECTAADAVKYAKIPILLIHGEDDRFVPCDMSREIYKNNPQKIQLETFPKAGHGLCYMTDPVRYQHITGQFLRRLDALRPWMENTDKGENIR